MSEHFQAFRADLNGEHAAQTEQLQSQGIGFIEGRQVEEQPTGGLQAKHSGRQHVGLGEVSTAWRLSGQGERFPLFLTSRIDVQHAVQVSINTQEPQLFEIGIQLQDAPESGLRILSCFEDKASRHGTDRTEVEHISLTFDVQLDASGVARLGDMQPQGRFTTER